MYGTYTSSYLVALVAAIARKILPSSFDMPWSLCHVEAQTHCRTSYDWRPSHHSAIYRTLSYWQCVNPTIPGSEFLDSTGLLA